MPNWCINNVTLKANNVGNRRALKEVVCAIDAGEYIFNKLRPMPDHIFRGMLDYAEFKKHGNDNWRDWSIANWGTKWDTEAENIFYDEETLSLKFDTAWSPPIELYEYLVYQGFSVFADYYEPGMNFAGIYANGDDRVYDNMPDKFFETDPDGKLLDAAYGILQERAEFDE